MVQAVNKISSFAELFIEWSVWLCPGSASPPCPCWSLFSMSENLPEWECCANWKPPCHSEWLLILSLSSCYLICSLILSDCSEEQKCNCYTHAMGVVAKQLLLKSVCRRMGLHDVSIACMQAQVGWVPSHHMTASHIHRKWFFFYSSSCPIWARLSTWAFEEFLFPHLLFYSGVWERDILVMSSVPQKTMTRWKSILTHLFSLAFKGCF